MSDYEKMLRVSKTNPCPVCGKPDWCLVAPDGSAAICQRVSEGAVKLCGKAGWLHVLHDRSPLDKPRPKRIRIISTQPLYRQWDVLTEHYQKRIRARDCTQYAKKMDLSERSLDQFCIGWNGYGYTFPMRDGAKRIVGIQIRRLNGEKLCEQGSRLGLFIPRSLRKSRYLMVCEGLSDAVAAMDLGFFAVVGRASCQTGEEDLVPLCRGREQIVIVGDNDPPGRNGAETLAGKLALYCPQVKILYPPAGYKDLRNWKNWGVTTHELRWAILQAPIENIEVHPGRPS